MARVAETWFFLRYFGEFKSTVQSTLKRARRPGTKNLVLLERGVATGASMLSPLCLHCKTCHGGELEGFSSLLADVPPPHEDFSRAYSCGNPQRAI